MARIRTYQSDVNTAGPQRFSSRDATAADFGGGGLSGFGDAVDKLGTFLTNKEEQDDKTSVRTMLQQARGEWTQHLIDKQTSTDHGATDFTKSFLSDFDSYVEKAGQNVRTAEGQRLFASSFADLRSDFITKAYTFEASSRASKAKSDYLTGLNADEGTLQLDPSQFGKILQGQKDALNDPNSLFAKLPAAARDELWTNAREQLTLAAIRGEIRQNPEAAKEKLIGGAWNDTVDATKIHAITGEADAAIRARRVDADLKYQEQKRQRAEAELKAGDEWLKKIYDGSASANAILSDNRLDPFGTGGKHMLLNVLEARTRQDSRTNPTVYNDIVSRIYAPDADPKKLVNEADLNPYMASGQITVEDGRKLRTEIQALRKPEEADGKAADKMAAQWWGEFAKMMRGTLVKQDPMGMPDPDGEQNYYIWLNAKRSEWEKGVADGKNPLDLLTPTSKDFIGFPQRKAPQQLMQDMAERMRNAKGVAAPDGSVAEDMKRRPGETVDQWRERTGRK